MGKLPLLLSRAPLGDIPDLEAQGGLAAEAILHLARRRQPLLVLLEGEEEDGDLEEALGRLPRPPTILRGKRPDADELRREVASALAHRAGREALAGLLAGPLASEPAGFAQRLLALSAADDAPLLIRGGSLHQRRETSRAIHDLTPPRRVAPAPWVALDATIPSERALLEAFLAAGAPPFRAGAVHVEGLSEDSPDLRARLAAHLRALREDSPRWIFGRGEQSLELPPELECRCLALDPPDEPRGPLPSGATPHRLDELEREHVLRVLDECSGNKSRTASRLGIHRSTLHTKLRAWGLGGGGLGGDRGGKELRGECREARQPGAERGSTGKG